MFKVKTMLAMAEKNVYSEFLALLPYIYDKMT